MRIRVDCTDLVYIELVKDLKNTYLSIEQRKANRNRI